MADTARCYRCGESLAALTLPFSRRDECPSCAAHVHVCRMCVHFDAVVPKKCREDDAEEVTEKERANFCDWFKPGSDTFDPVRASKAAKAESALAALFGGDEGGEPRDADDQLKRAEDLFR
ncbi:MAG TPA: hypothetical protein VFY27_06160 [Woeseiaceae bacterium]|nr:hypothetical protein [Woeseiaceae bacterium]